MIESNFVKWKEQSNFKNLVLLLIILPENSTIEGFEKNTILVRGLDCLDRTPLLDIKPALVNESVNMRCD